MTVNVWGNVGGVVGYLPLSALTGLTGQLLGMNAAATLAEWKAATFLASQMAVPVGSAGTPSYTFTGDLNTGFYQDGIDTLGFTTAGTKRLALSAAGAIFAINIVMNGKLLQESKGADIVAAALTDFGNATGNFLAVTNAAGATNIASLGGATLPSGTEIESLITITGGSITIIHDAVALICLGGANVALQNGDVIRWRKINSAAANWQMVSIARGINTGILTTAGDLLVGLGAGVSSRFAVGTDGYGLTATSDPAEKMAWLAHNNGFSILNGYLDWSVAANALTVAVKTNAGQDPSPASPVYVYRKNNTQSVATVLISKITAATSIVVSNGSNLGTRNNIPFRVWAVIYNGAGATVELGVIQTVTTVAGAGAGNDVQNIFSFQAGFAGNLAITAEGGAGAADSAGIVYGNINRTNKGIAVGGYASWETGLPAAGAWSAAPTRITPFQLGSPLPGDVIAESRLDTGALATGATIIPVDDSIPQNTEGDQFLAAPAHTPISAANVLEVEWQGFFDNNTVSGITSALFRDATANALAAVSTNAAGVLNRINQRGNKSILADAITATTFKIRAGGAGAGTTTFNGNAAARFMGGVMNSFITVKEKMT